MSLVLAEHEIYQACEIIFGPELAVTQEFLEYLQPSGIKTAYRKRALETHPDRFASQDDRLQKQNSELFHSVQEAYENLIKFLNARENGFRFSSAAMRQRPTPRWHKPQAAKAKPAQQRANTTEQPRPNKQQSRQQSTSQNSQRRRASTRTQSQDNFHNQKHAYNTFWNTQKLYQGPLPNRRLLLGHFLYYSGIATWHTIVQALIWQRTQRPRLGEIGQRFGILSEQDILHVLRQKEFLQPFGESALSLGLLTESQLRMLVFYQKRLQRKFGEFFVEKKILRPEQLDRLLQQYHEHNSRLSREFARFGSRFK